MKTINVRLGTEQKVQLERMANELRMSQTNLINLAVASLLANYEKKGSFILVDILNPEHRNSPKSPK